MTTDNQHGGAIFFDRHIAIDNLKSLESQLRHDLDILNYPLRNWVPARKLSNGDSILNVLIIGGGQSGLGVAFGLQREKIESILVIDENSEGQEGPWTTFARMPTLRTPKHVSGPDFGIPSLSVRAWIEAQGGLEAWSALSFISTQQWADYLSWYRRVLNLPVQNKTKAVAIDWLAEEQCFKIRCISRGAETFLFARKVVLATGIDGSGQWQVPAELQSLPKSHCFHTRESIPFNRFFRKKLAVLGAGASAFDNAAAALEAGAAEVHLLFRRKQLPNINPYRWAEFTGFLKHHGDLPDSDRWAFIQKITEMGQLPPRATLQRCLEFRNFHLHPASPCLSSQLIGEQVELTTPKGPQRFDAIIAGSGFATNLSMRPELQSLHDKILLWRDRFTPPNEQTHAELGSHPYLGPHFEFQPKSGEHPYVSSIFNFNFGCLLSLGLGGASISGMKYGFPRLITGLTQQFFMEDRHTFFSSLCEYREVEYSNQPHRPVSDETHLWTSTITSPFISHDAHQ